VEERELLISLRKDVEEKLVFLEQELALASPLTHGKDQHDTLIKKTRAFHNALTDITKRLAEPDR